MTRLIEFLIEDFAINLFECLSQRYVRKPDIYPAIAENLQRTKR